MYPRIRLYIFVLTYLYSLRSQYDLLALFVILASLRYEFSVAVANILSAISAAVFIAGENIGRGLAGASRRKTERATKQIMSRGREEEQ